MFKDIFKETNLFTFFTKFLLVVLPFYVIIKVYLDSILNVWFLGFFIKEFIVVLLFFILVYEYFFNKKNKDIKLKFDFIDYAIFAFIFYGIFITIANWLWFDSILYWWRYWFLWFVVFLIYKHWKIFLKEKTKKLIKLFMISALVSLFLWVMVKFVLWEEILSFFWFSIQVSEFWFGWGIPIYQWVEASWIRRFQWILDSPLAMWFFLILFMGLFSHLNRKNLDFAFYLGFIILSILIFLTYSRAAMLGVIAWVLIISLYSFKTIFKYHKKTLTYIFITLIIIIGWLWYIFEHKLHSIFIREGSTTGHSVRMEIWMNRFIENPLGAGLAAAWPGYRSVINEEITLKTDRYHIPESWFIQILVEWWIIYFALFMIILWNILLNLYKNKYKYILVMFIWVLIMNMFLHVFEFTYLTILLFLFLGLFYNREKLQKRL